MNKDNTVQQAGGFIIQVMPFAEEETIAKLEENVQKIQSDNHIFWSRDILQKVFWRQVLDGFDIEFTDKVPTEFYCNCSKERVEKALIKYWQKGSE